MDDHELWTDPFHDFRVGVGMLHPAVRPLFTDFWPRYLDSMKALVDVGVGGERWLEVFVVLPIIIWHCLPSLNLNLTSFQRLINMFLSHHLTFVGHDERIFLRCLGNGELLKSTISLSLQGFAVDQKPGPQRWRGFIPLRKPLIWSALVGQTLSEWLNGAMPSCSKIS